MGIDQVQIIFFVNISFFFFGAQFEGAFYI